MIIVRLSGGMGNQMFQYALGRALALRHNVHLKLDTTFLYNQTKIPLVRSHFVQRPYALDVFNISADIAEKKDIPWQGRPFLWGIIMQGVDALLRKLAFLPGWEKKFTFDSHVQHFAPDTYLVGFWQSEKYFSEYANVIRNDFTLKQPLSNLSKVLQDEIKNTESVCVHIRRSDIAGNSFHNQIDLSYYKKGIAKIAETCSVEKLYIFSDDIEWCKSHVKFEHLTVFVGNEHAGEKDSGVLALMKACKHFVIANSTFSWWAAWLAENPAKIVIAPKRWFGTAPIDDSDLIPQSWIRI